MRKCIIIASFAASTFLASTLVFAQDMGDLGHGRVIARTVCSECHAVGRGKLRTPMRSRNFEAPPFRMLAGMTAIALNATLLTFHRQMPNLNLQPDQRRDVIAYILSLK
jgi:cytochrome c